MCFDRIKNVSWIMIDMFFSKNNPNLPQLLHSLLLVSCLLSMHYKKTRCKVLFIFVSYLIINVEKTLFFTSAGKFTMAKRFCSVYTNIVMLNKRPKFWDVCYPVFNWHQTAQNDGEKFQILNIFCVKITYSQ